MQLLASQQSGATATVKASYGDTSAAPASIAMRPTVSKRGYGIVPFDQGYDKDYGWDFGSNGLGPQLFFVKDETITGTFSLKFQQDEAQPPDKGYFTFNGAVADSIDQEPNTPNWISEWEYNNSAPRDALGLDTNWLPVDGHRVEIYIDEIIDDAGNVVTTNPERYVYLVGANAAGRVSGITNPYGKVSLQLKSGPWIHRCREIKLRAVDKQMVKAGP